MGTPGVTRTRRKTAAAKTTAVFPAVVQLAVDAAVELNSAPLTIPHKPQRLTASQTEYPQEQWQSQLSQQLQSLLVRVAGVNTTVEATSEAVWGYIGGRSWGERDHQTGPPAKAENGTQRKNYRMRIGNAWTVVRG